MTITVPPELEAIIARKIASGAFQSPSEVVGASLRLLSEQEEQDGRQLADLRREILLGIEEADQGKLAPLNAQETLARIRRQRPDESPQTR